MIYERSVTLQANSLIDNSSKTAPTFTPKNLQTQQIYQLQSEKIVLPDQLWRPPYQPLLIRGKDDYTLPHTLLFHHPLDVTNDFYHQFVSFPFFGQCVNRNNEIIF